MARQKGRRQPAPYNYHTLKLGNNRKKVNMEAVPDRTAPPEITIPIVEVATVDDGFPTAENLPDRYGDMATTPDQFKRRRVALMQFI